MLSAAVPGSTLHPSPAGGAAWLPLAPHAPVLLRRGICLRSRLQSSGCKACVEACPVGALRIGSAGVQLQGGCTGCGRCHAACPVGALVAHGFPACLEAPDARCGQEVVLECARFAPGAAHARVPCLGGVSPAALLALCAHAPQSRVVLVDHGACGSCDSGNSGDSPAHPAQALVDQVAGWMRTAGVTEALLPRIERRASIPEAASARGDDPLQSRGRARRGFLGALARPAAARPIAGDAPSPREQVLTALAALASRHGGRVAPELFHHLEVDASCTGLRVCAATCPTGALIRYRNDEAGVAGIAFEARDCIGCNHCASVCPNHALRVLPGAGVGLGRRPLTRFVQRECADCGARFPARAAEAVDRCERCRKGAQLARAAFTALFSAKTRLQGME